MVSGSSGHAPADRARPLANVPQACQGPFFLFYATMLGVSQPQQVAEPQAGMRCKVDGVGDISGASLLDTGDVGFGPDDLGAVAAVELLDALAGVAGDPAERIDGIGQHTRQYL